MGFWDKIGDVFKNAKVQKGMGDALSGFGQGMGQQGGMVPPMGPQGPQQGMIFGQPQMQAPPIMPFSPQDHLKRLGRSPLMSQLRLQAPDLTRRDY
jgi:hypothetical protein